MNYTVKSRATRYNTLRAIKTRHFILSYNFRVFWRINFNNSCTNGNRNE